MRLVVQGCGQHGQAGSGYAAEQPMCSRAVNYPSERPPAGRPPDGVINGGGLGRFGGGLGGSIRVVNYPATDATNVIK